MNAASIQIAKARGSLQCGDPGVAPDAMRKTLEDARVRVLAARCGTDGRMRPAVCGGGTGELNVFDIAPADLDKAQALGFVSLSALRDAEVVPCR